MRREGRSTFEGNSIRFAKSYVYFLGLVSSTEKKREEREGEGKLQKVNIAQDALDGGVVDTTT